jgi:hypothetical protein
MSISPRKGRTNSFEEARKAYQPQINKDIRANKGDGEATADPDPDNSAVISPERPHPPWLVPGAGRL